MEGLGHALRSLVEGLDGLLESPRDLLGDLDGSEGGLLVIWETSSEDLGAFWDLLERSWVLLDESWEPSGSLLRAFRRLVEDI